MYVYVDLTFFIKWFQLIKKVNYIKMSTEYIRTWYNDEQTKLKEEYFQVNGIKYLY